MDASGRDAEPKMETDLLDVKIVHIFVVLVSSLVGMTTPVYFSKNASIDTMFVLRSFGTGAFSLNWTSNPILILASFVHVTCVVRRSYTVSFFLSHVARFWRTRKADELRWVEWSIDVTGNRIESDCRKALDGFGSNEDRTQDEEAFIFKHGASRR